jgi:hypothetical protein
MKRFLAVAILTSTVGVAACHKDKKAETQFVSGSSASPQSAADLILAAQRQGALLPPELADARIADESTLPMKAFDLPQADLSSATAEQEPNNSENPTPMGPSMAGRGQIVQGDYDFFSFKTSGEPQLFAIEAVGKGVGNLLYRDAGETLEGQQVQPGRFVIANLFLSPGDHVVEVRGAPDGSPYTIRAIPMGKPDPRMEREPNNSESLAHAVRPGIARAGLLLESGDRDFYRFSLRQDEHVLLQITPPPDMPLYAAIDGASKATISFRSDKKGEAMKFEGMLAPGDYTVRVQTNEGGSRSPYKIRLDILDPFSVPADAEPNNTPESASPLPADMILRGTAGEFTDADWYRMPIVTQPTTVRVQVLGLTGTQKVDGLLSMLKSSTPGSTQYVDWNRRDSIVEGTLPPNVPVYLRMEGPASYQLRLVFTPGINVASQAQLPVTMALPAGPHLVEAFSRKRQRLPMPVKLHNGGNETVQLRVEPYLSNVAWRATRPVGLVTIGAGKDVVIPMEVLVPPDAGAGEAVRVAVRASSPGGKVSAMTQVFALCGAIAVNPDEYPVLPSQLIGGLDVASTALGAHPVAEGSKRDKELMLYDGLTPNNAWWIGFRSGSEDQLTVTVALGGDRAPQLSGVTLIPAPGEREDQPQDFDVLVSDDGQNFQNVLSGRMSWEKVEQAFAFTRPVAAKFAQLRLKNNQGNALQRNFELAEFKVIATPGDHPFNSAGFNLADTALGGYVAYSRPLLPVPTSVITSEDDGSPIRLDPANTNEFVVGFRQNRAAMIASLDMVQPTATNGRPLSSLDISVSAENATGPWTKVATWKIDPKPGASSNLTLPSPVWARFVRFTSTEATRADEWWRLPETIRIREAPTSQTYRSIIGEWGHYSRDAIYERLVARPAKVVAGEITGNGKKDDAADVKLGTTYNSRAVLGEKEDWYKIEIPKDQNHLSVVVDGDPMLKVAATLEDKSGKQIPVELQKSHGRAITLQARVEGGEEYFLRVYEPPRSVALVWDNSGSISPYAATLYRALAKFVEVVQPRKEFVNMLPFQDTNPRFLLNEWSDQPYTLQGAVQSYARQDGSSNAELNLLLATQELQAREGNKAILLLTDAASNGYEKTSELWSALSDVQPQIFAVELHAGGEARKQQQMMQAWTDANGGYYSVFRNSEDIDKAFDRASCMLRQPARYTMIATASYIEPPAPGALEVVLAANAALQNAVEIIFDASGSMLQQMGASRRIDIAKSVLTNLVQKTIPAGTPFAFRAFGTKKANCDTDLLLDVAPLDRAKVSSLLRGMTAINNAKTPIGASLRAVAEDLKGAKGQKVVVLVTDGEETCGGDPAGAIKYLRDQGLDVRVNIVGFGVDDAALKVTFDRWAEMGGGRFFDVKNGTELNAALNEALRPKYQILDSSGQVVADGTAGGAAVKLPAGVYTVRVLTSPVRTFERVQVSSSATQRVEVR